MNDGKEAKEMENGERLAKLEQQTDNIERIVSEVNENFKTFTAVYVPRTEIQLMLDARDKEISEVKEELKEKATKTDVGNIGEKIENNRDDKRDWKRNLPTWCAVIIAIIAIILPFLGGV